MAEIVARRLRAAALCLGVICAVRPVSGQSAPPATLANDNTVRAGVMRDDTLRVALELRDATWLPEGARGRPVRVLAFAEVGRAPSVPGPMLRLRAGTPVEVTVANRTGRRAVVHGLHDHDGRADSLVLADGATGAAAFTPRTATSGFYWARTASGGRTVGRGEDSQLAGAFIVDADDASVPHERVMVITAFDDTVPSPPEARFPGRVYQVFAVNGRSWPATERLEYQQGDTITWRVINVSDHSHPMHLHGFYFTVTSRGTPWRDTVYSVGARRDAVTELMFPSTTMTIEWTAERAGNWLFHCHMINHIDTALRPEVFFGDAHGGHEASHDRVEDVMSGLVTAIRVRPRDGRVGAVPAPAAAPRRTVKLFVTQRDTPGGTPRFSYVVQRGARPPAADSMVRPSDAIELVQDEPAAIVVTNLSRQATAVHWHGLELESYYDGVAGWSGADSRTAPMMAPGDSFVVRLTPPRAGTYMYHTHVDEMVQLPGGLFGPFIVRPPGATVRDTTERIVMIADAGAVVDSARAAAVELRAGVVHRIRLASIPVANVMTVRLLAGGAVIPWRVVAKDGADIPLARQHDEPAATTLGAGETLDVLVRVDAPQRLMLEVGRRGSPAPPSVTPIVVR